MESEKTIYWMTLGVLALATINGFATGHRGWSDRLADRSIAMMARTSEVAANYAEVASEVLGNDATDSEPLPQSLVDVQDEIQPRLACAERILAKRQAQLARLQALQVQVRMVERVPRTIVFANPNIVVEVPQLPEMPQQDTF